MPHYLSLDNSLQMFLMLQFFDQLLNLRSIFSLAVQLLHLFRLKMPEYHTVRLSEFHSYLQYQGQVHLLC